MTERLIRYSNEPADINTFDMMDRQNQAFVPELQAQQLMMLTKESKKADDAHQKKIQLAKANPNLQ